LGRGRSVFYLELFKALQDDGVRYVVIGGLAVNLHAYARRVEKDLGRVRVPIACVDDLIALKTGTGRVKDESDISALRALQAERDKGGPP
jgi:predicted nucleotidyltransferase